jgi:hypothetical protein
MATQLPVNKTFKAAGDLSAAQYLFQKVSAAQTVTTCTAITDKAVGVLQNNPKNAGEDAVVAIGGTTKVIASAAIGAGVVVAPDATGKAQIAVSTQYGRGLSIDAAGGASEKIEILLIGLYLLP